MTTRKWTRQRVVECIQEWHRRGTTASRIWRVDRNLCAAGTALFGTWRAALEAAGLLSDRHTWSAERVLAELRAERDGRTSDGPSRPDKSRITAAAIRYFGSRRQALVAAGLPPNHPPRVLRTWTPAQVIEALQSRRQSGLSLTAVWKDDKALYAIAKRTFGSWRRALQAAGFEHRGALSRQDVIQAIRSRHHQTQPMIGVWKTDPSLFNAAKRCFGNWQAALAAAGLPSKPRQRRWSKRTVVEAIRRRHQNGPPLSHAWRDDKPLFRAATRHFGNWQSALRAAGVAFKARQRWTRERVLEGLRQTYRSQPNFRYVDHSLVGAAFRFFGGLHQALEAAGLPPPPGRWTKRRIVEEIQERYVRGQPIEFVGFKDKALGYAAKRHFGTWHAAVAAAGLESRAPPPVITRTWTPDAVLAAIRAKSEPGTSVAPIWKQDTGLYSVAKKHFGTWREAVLAAGLQPAQRRWTRELVIQEILARNKRGLALTSGVVFQEDCRLAGAALRYFGSWRAAKAAAGLEAIDHQTANEIANSGEKGNGMSREDVIRQIVERDVQNLGLTEELVTLETPELYAAACEFYGTWDTALQYAGISERRVAAADLSKPEHVLRKIRQLCLDGYDLSASRNKERDRQLFNAARRHFGSWKRALRAVGMNLEQARPSSRPRSLNRDRIIETLRQRHTAGLSLTWGVVCLENRVFAIAAKQLFRSWRRALEAAGLLPERNATGASRKWDRQTILEAIRLRQQQGKSLQCTRVRKEQAGLVSAARRYFATWDQAVAAAAVPTSDL